MKWRLVAISMYYALVEQMFQSPVQSVMLRKGEVLLYCSLSNLSQQAAKSSLLLIHAVRLAYVLLLIVIDVCPRTGEIRYYFATD